MSDPLFWHRIQFAFTIVFHYLFPQLTMGLALLLVILWRRAHRSEDAIDRETARFWTKVFGLNFALGVVTGIPMEFQLAANWGAFARWSGGVVGQTLAMEGLFAFMLESAFLGLLVFGEKRLSKRMHFAASCALFVGSWLSGYFIVTTNAFLQHPVGHAFAANGRLRMASFPTFLFNPWGLVQYAHTMVASVVTASFVVAAISALWLLRASTAPEDSRARPHAERSLALAARVGLIASILVAFPTGDLHAKMVAKHQPATLAAMEGRFESGAAAPLALIGQPNVKEKRLDNPIVLPGALSFLAYGTFHADVPGLDAFPENERPTNIEALYYAFHLMAGIGTLQIGLFALTNLLLWRKRLFQTTSILWAHLLAFPAPYIATTAGWMTAELGRQPWIVYGLFRTADGASPKVHAGSTLFTLLGFCGLYFVLGLAFLYLLFKMINHGPVGPAASRGAETIAPEVPHA
jgi:cytochrome d ubiquinol oxidase subunit I